MNQYVLYTYVVVLIREGIIVNLSDIFSVLILDDWGGTFP